MDDIHDLKGRARALESSGQDAAALDAYLRALGTTGGETDAGLRAKIGSLHLRLGNVDDAIESFARASELYAAAGLRNNSLALCNRILETDAARTEFYLRLGELSAEQGYLRDAKRGFGEYESRMQVAGDEEAVARGRRSYALYFPDGAHQKSTPAPPPMDLAPGRDDDSLPVLDSPVPDEPSAGIEDFGLVGNLPQGEWSEDPPESLPPLEPAPLVDAPAGEPRIEPLEGLETAYAAESAGEAVPAEDIDTLPLLGTYPEHLPTEEGGEDEPDADPLPLLSSTLPDLLATERSTSPASPIPTPDSTILDELHPDRSVDEEVVDDEVVGEQVVSEEVVEEEDVEEQSVGAEMVADEAVPEVSPNIEEGLRERIAAAPEDPVGHELLVEHLAEFGSIPELETALAVAHAAAAAAGEFGAAADFAARLAGVRPDDASVLQTWAEYAYRSGDRHRLVTAYLAVARRFAAADQTASARPIYERIIKLEPDNEEARRALGVPDPPSAEDGDYVDFGAMVLDDVEEDSTRFQVEAGFPTGDEVHDFGEILSAFRQQISEKLDASDSASHYDLGLAFKEMGLWDDAITQLQRALRAGSNPLGTLEVLGECYVEKGEHDKAARMLDRAVQLPGTEETDLIGVYYWLGRSREGLGEASAARESYQRVTTADRAFRDAAQRLETLGEF